MQLYVVHTYICVCKIIIKVLCLYVFHQIHTNGKSHHSDGCVCLCMCTRIYIDLVMNAKYRLVVHQFLACTYIQTYIHDFYACPLHGCYICIHTYIYANVLLHATESLYVLVCTFICMCVYIYANSVTHHKVTGQRKTSCRKTQEENIANKTKQTLASLTTRRLNAWIVYACMYMYVHVSILTYVQHSMHMCMQAQTDTYTCMHANPEANSII